jgi:DNA-binding XRE family transcriptional regulator
MDGHLNDARYQKGRRGNNRKADWIRLLLHDGVKPLMRTVAIVEPEEGKSLECQYIAALFRRDFKLTNKAHRPRPERAPRRASAPPDELRAFMARRGFTRAAIGDAIGVTDAFIGMILSGDSQPSLKTAKALLAFCQSREPGMTFERLFASKAA